MRKIVGLLPLGALIAFVSGAARAQSGDKVIDYFALSRLPAICPARLQPAGLS